MAKRPGGELATRPLHFIWITDCSGSMSVDGKIQSLNQAIRDALPHMRNVADENPNADIMVRVLKFSSGAQWHVSQPTPVADFKWVDLQASGVTDLGRALSMLAEQLRIPPMTDRALPPVLVLISDGQPTDDFGKGLQELMDEPWGKKSVRIAIAIGADADLQTLQRFIGHTELQPLKANNSDDLVRYIKWASTVVTKLVAAPASQISGGLPNGLNVPIPTPPVALAKPIAADDVW